MRGIVWLSDISKKDIPLAGGKGANLGELVRNNFPVPPAFVVSAEAYFDFVKSTGIVGRIIKTIDAINVESSSELEKETRKIRELIASTPMGSGLETEIKKAYAGMGGKKAGAAGSGDACVAVRSSATAEDLPEASFAGQQETYLNVVGREDVVDAVKKCWASLFTARATYYRRRNNFSTANVGIAVIVQKMVNSDVSGVMFTADPNGDRTKIVIEAGYGLGEAVVSGSITPDQYVVGKETGSIAGKKLSVQEWLITRAGRGTKRVDVPASKKSMQKLTDAKIVELAKIGKRIEEHYRSPQDIEWALEGQALYIVQSRPITTLNKGNVQKETISTASKALVVGFAASPGIAFGRVRVVPSAGDISRVVNGDVLATKMTSPDWVPAMQKSAAIITDEGGSTCHAAIVSRELGIPCVVGTGNATRTLRDGQEVTVDGYSGRVYDGTIRLGKPKENEEEIIADSEISALEAALKKAGKKLHFSEGAGPAEKKREIEGLLAQISVRVKVNVALPEATENAAKTGAAGVGLLRAEHMITASGKHPAAFVREGNTEALVDAVKKGAGKVAKFFSGKPVWFRTFDARTDEFRNLEGGDKEPKEDNPMLGWHGIRRDLDEPELLKAQFRAIKELADEGLANVGIMLPFVQSAAEVREAKEIARECGLKPGKGGTAFGVMVETPAATWVIDELIAEGIDFISFGTNDLTQLTLGVDRNNEHIQKLFNELHPGVLRQLEYVISRCRKNGVETSICGQAASDPEMVRKLTAFGIDSVSANIDAVGAIRKVVILEKKKALLAAGAKP